MSRARVTCTEVYESFTHKDGRITFEWLWLILGDGERRFVLSPNGRRRCAAAGTAVSARAYVGDGVYVEFDSGFVGNTVLVTSDGLRDTNRIELEPEVWARLLMLRDVNDKRRRPERVEETTNGEGEG
jgi:hypothetical protein